MTKPRPAFVPGLTLNRRFYQEVVHPMLATHRPGLNHSAALIGYGSDVLGLDTPTSTDHNWGPRVQLFLTAADHAQHADTLDALSRAHLPARFLGYSVHFSAPDLADRGTQVAADHPSGPVNHLIDITTVESFFDKYLRVSPDQLLSSAEWLKLPEQKLLEVTTGEVFHDGLGTLEAGRAPLAYYPPDVWRVRLAAQWHRIAEEEPFELRNLAYVGAVDQFTDNVAIHSNAALAASLDVFYQPPSANARLRRKIAT